ncbi:MAG: TraR/DksA C4-type zinc finger protein [Verrucomicrobia bacterium]|nr:TraR/DksA C4-type zinc finger protein [Verrucomicrobiota bacterium]
MPAKKTTTKKATVKKAAAAKSKPVANASDSTAPVAKKGPAKKAARKATANATATKTESAETKPALSELVKRQRHGTPAIFKTNLRRQSPIVFTMEDVRTVLAEREKDKGTEVSGITTQESAQSNETRTVVVDDIPIKNTRHASATLADILGFSPGMPSPSRRDESMVPEKWLPYYRSLIELRDHLRDSLGMHANDTLKRSQKEDAGDISTSADAGTDNFDRDFALSLLSTEQEALKEVEAAIDRVFDGSYGVCEITGEEINPERLEAVPFTRFSLEGQIEHERNQRRRVQRTGAFLSEGAADGVSFLEEDADN